LLVSDELRSIAGVVMTKESIKLRVSELQNAFKHTQYIEKKALRDFYAANSSDFSEQKFRRVLYRLEKNSIISSTGSGVYYLYEDEEPRKMKYRPNPSESLNRIAKRMKKSFPYLKYQIWETRILNEFLVLQLGQNHLILDVEKDATSSVFNQLSEKYTGKIFLDPDRSTMARYVQPLPEAIIISKLVSQTPMGRKVEAIPYAPIEKILVDLLVDDEKFDTLQENELIAIYNGFFDMYLVDPKSLLRYAGRRNAIPKLQEFVSNRTKIKIFGLD